MLLQYPYSIFPLGDSAITIDFGNVISEPINQKIHFLFGKLQREPFPGMIEALPAYSSLTIFYDVLLIKKNISGNKTILNLLKEKIEKFIEENSETDIDISRNIKIPVCYDEEFGMDIKNIAEKNGISKEEVIRIHYGKSYRVYMLGFLPGFPYMGEVDEKISVPRKSQPQVIVAGSVAVANKQTGIYPLTSPGGWSVIGRTPLKMFDAEKKDSTLLNAGDIVTFYPITKKEFLEMQS